MLSRGAQGEREKGKIGARIRRSIQTLKIIIKLQDR